MEPRPRRNRPGAVAAWTPAARSTSRCCCRASTSGHEDSEGGGVHTRGVPVVPVGTANGERLVTTVFDLMLAQYGVGRDGLPGDWPTATTTRSPTPLRGRRRSPACRPNSAARIGREFAQNAEDSGGRSMIILGAGTNHWFHSDIIYRTFLAHDHPDRVPGDQRRRLGALRRAGEVPPGDRLGEPGVRSGLATPCPPDDRYGVLVRATPSQWRYDNLGADLLATPLGEGRFEGTHDDRHPGAVGPIRLDAVVPELEPQPAADRARGSRGRGRTGRVRQSATPVRGLEVRGGGPRRSGELAAGPDRVAGQPAWVVQQGQRVLPQAPARDQQRGACRGDRCALRGHHLARRGTDRQTRPAGELRTSA